MRVTVTDEYNDDAFNRLIFFLTLYRFSIDRITKYIYITYKAQLTFSCLSLNRLQLLQLVAD